MFCCKQPCFSSELVKFTTFNLSILFFWISIIQSLQCLNELCLVLLKTLIKRFHSLWNQVKIIFLVLKKQLWAWLVIKLTSADLLMLIVICTCSNLQWTVTLSDLSLCSNSACHSQMYCINNAQVTGGQRCFFVVFFFNWGWRGWKWQHVKERSGLHNVE